jgi:hypothetical protein
MGFWSFIHTWRPAIASNRTGELLRFFEKQTLVNDDQTGECPCQTLEIDPVCSAIVRYLVVFVGML